MSSLFGLPYIGQGGKTVKLLISASATVGGLLLVALMGFWGCFLYKKLGRVESKTLAIDVSGGEPYRLILLISSLKNGNSVLYVTLKT